MTFFFVQFSDDRNPQVSKNNIFLFMLLVVKIVCPLLHLPCKDSGKAFFTIHLHQKLLYNFFFGVCRTRAHNNLPSRAFQAISMKVAWAPSIIMCAPRAAHLPTFQALATPSATSALVLPIFSGVFLSFYSISFSIIV